MTESFSLAPGQPVPVSRFFTSADGLRLHLRDWAPPASAERAMPVICLPGLGRTADDFDALAARLAHARRVVAFDYRGRGLSDRDPDWKNYTLAVEDADIQSILDTLGIEQAIIVGTSRGGLHAMLFAVTRPTLARAVVLNDIGPVIEPKGLMRIQGYIGKLPSPTSWAEAASLCRRGMSEHFTQLSDADFEAYARLTFEEKNGSFSMRYDPNLSKQLEGLDFSVPMPDMWPQFEAMSAVPILAIRGENSDLLSPETLVEMAKRHPQLETYVVPGQGHAPLLIDAPSIERIARFVENHA